VIGVNMGVEHAGDAPAMLLGQVEIDLRVQRGDQNCAWRMMDMCKRANQDSEAQRLRANSNGHRIPPK